MNTHNVNTAASESSKTWVENQYNQNLFSSLFIRDDAGNYAMASHSQILSEAAKVIELRYPSGTAFTKNEVVEEFFRAKLAGSEREVFAVAFLNNQNELIAYRELFLGTINTTCIYPREVMRAAMAFNAAALILAHNHPSFYREASRHDIEVTRKIVDVMNAVNVRVLDHIIVAGNTCVSMASRGQM
ncbi:JAB domain-containing protein [Pantoea coffeiphila]|uniref:DNA repair protein RadC n=1 Tax=Pantoea coffeiphila TaxID=1465635 RepID=A0A2S9I3J9_9GAMM|nr:JAB domain-containing protein [Pantoea coffeiphila]PRD12345.1 DNA repair protein RadC [Pantoea coffeiphila]